jgi:xanthine dehydrogenase accessory factor
MNRQDLLKAAVARDRVCALVTVSSTEGSAPRDAGAWMIVTRQGFHGTIGGGALEWRAMAEAQAMLEKNVAHKESSHVLGPDLGQCCGGRVRIVTELISAQNIEKFERDEALRRHVMVFGAGHVGRALIMAMAPLPFSVSCIDNRPNAFPTHLPANVEAVMQDDPVQQLANARAGAIAFIMTHSHTLDLAIVDAALRQTDVAHVGLIGSATKRARFVSRLKDAGITGEQFEKFICPIGVAGIGGKEPGIIAASCAAQLLVLDERLQRVDRFEFHANMSA